MVSPHLRPITERKRLREKFVPSTSAFWCGHFGLYEVVRFLPVPAGAYKKIFRILTEYYDIRNILMADFLDTLGSMGVAITETVKKGLERVISDRNERRSSTRQWCREGKPPKCGWWPQEEAP